MHVWLRSSLGAPKGTSGKERPWQEAVMQETEAASMVLDLEDGQLQSSQNRDQLRKKQECMLLGVTMGGSSRYPWTTAALATLWNLMLFASSCLLSSLCNEVCILWDTIQHQIWYCYKVIHADTRPRWGHSPVVSSHCAHIENPFSVAFLVSIQKPKLSLLCLKLACCYLTVLYDHLMKYSLNAVLK